MASPDISQFDHTPYYWSLSRGSGVVLEDSGVLPDPLSYLGRSLSRDSGVVLEDSASLQLQCEENVYKLCKQLCSAGIADADSSDLFVVFISNDKKQIPLWHQKASQRADGVILWDYHVICIQRKRNEDSSQVWDLDSTLPFPSPLKSYVAETFRSSFQLFSEFQRYYRIVHAPIFLRHFASDRRHMKDSNGNWIAQPPSYDPIVAEDGAVHNLNEYMEIHGTDVVPTVEPSLIDVVSRERLGLVVGEDQLEDFFSLPL